MRTYYVYILTNQSRTLYVGMTSNLNQRVEQHRSGRIPGFASRYRLSKLVYFEETSDAHSAVNRERQIKRWSRKWKLRQIDEFNPHWRDLTAELLTG